MPLYHKNDPLERIGQSRGCITEKELLRWIDKDVCYGRIVPTQLGEALSVCLCWVFLRGFSVPYLHPQLLSSESCELVFFSSSKQQYPRFEHSSSTSLSGPLASVHMVQVAVPLAHLG